MISPSQQNHLTPRKHAKESRRQALIDAANAVFAEHGFDCATTRAIAERAGCAEGLIHRYFNGKHGLLLAILQNKAGDIAAHFDADLPDRDTVEAEIEQLLLWHLDAMWERRDFMRVCVSQAAISPEVGRTVGNDVNRRRVELILEKLQRHRQFGRIRPDLDLEALAQTIAGLGFAAGFFLQVCFGDDREYARRTLLAAASVISRGISPPAAQVHAKEGGSL